MARERAVVIGGGVAGLCAARALVRHFTRVTVLEATPPPGRGELPAHSDRLLECGRQDLERLFPGIVSGLLAAGAVEIDAGLGLAVRGTRGWQRQRETGRSTLFATRPLVAGCLRRRLAADRNVGLHAETPVRGLVAASGDWPRVTGVRLDAGVLAADLVVDASGRSSRAPEWIRELGLPRLAAPAESRVPARSALHERWYRRTERVARGWQGIRAAAAPGAALVSAGLLPAQSNLWALRLETGPDVLAPRDEAELFAWLESLPTRHVADALRTARPLSDLSYIGDDRCRLRHYERWPSLLGGYVALGQAVCALEPGADLGLGVSILGARILARQLEAGASAGPVFTRRFFAAQAAALRPAWRASGTGSRTQGSASERLQDLCRLTLARVAARLLGPRFAPPVGPTPGGAQGGVRR